MRLCASDNNCNFFLENVCNQHAVENIKTENVPNVVAENPLDKLDCKLILKVLASFFKKK